MPPSPSSSMISYRPPRTEPGVNVGNELVPPAGTAGVRDQPEGTDGTPVVISGCRSKAASHFSHLTAPGGLMDLHFGHVMPDGSTTVSRLSFTFDAFVWRNQTGPIPAIFPSSDYNGHLLWAIPGRAEEAIIAVHERLLKRIASRLGAVLQVGPRFRFALFRTTIDCTELRRGKQASSPVSGQTRAAFNVPRRARARPSGAPTRPVAALRSSTPQGFPPSL